MKASTLYTINKPIITEKSNMMQEKGVYVFSVPVSANKALVKSAVEEFFSVKVKVVRICTMKGKQKKFRQRIGVRSSWKKAYVTLDAGNKIDYGTFSGENTAK